MMQPSPYQQNIYNFIRDEHGSAIVKSVAGSGKTTCLMGSVEFVPEHMSVHLFGFNADTTKELKAKLEQLRTRTGRAFTKVRATTFHALGYGAIMKKLDMKFDNCKPDGRKVMTMLRNGLGQVDFDRYGSYVAKLVGLAKGMGIGAISPDTEAAWYSLIGHHDLFLDDIQATEERAIEIARNTLNESNLQGRRGIIDFDDQLYLPLLWKLRLWQNDFVFVDEAQDTNPVRRALAKLALKPGGRLIAVGDPRQAIYGFTGASHDALDLIQEEFNCRELPLTVCYRCGSDIVALAKTIVPYIEPWEGSETGKIETILVQKDIQPFLDTLVPGQAILCRNTAPLVKLAYRLIGRGKGCTIAGREIGKGLVELVKRFKSQSIATLEKAMEVHKLREIAKFTARGEEAKAEAVSDRIECIKTVIDNLKEGERTVEMLKYKLEALFSDDSNNSVILLSTIHKAKGREWDTVVMYAPELLPSKWARQQWQALQEDNLRYVAVTRAQKRLVFVPQLEAEAA